MAPFIRNDAMSYDAVKQCIQELIYNLNVPSRWGTQTPFTNLTFDWVCPEDLREQIPVIAGGEMPFAYGDLQAEMDMINRAYIEVMTSGDAKGRVFTFPIPTYNITPDFDWDHPNCEALFAMTAKYGLPYFQNFLNSELKPNMIRSMCCRLQLDLRELLKRGNGLFGSAEQTGSVGVVTINCARLGYLYANDEIGLYERIDELLGFAKDSLEVKRKVIQRLIDQGLFPYTKRYLGTLRNHFSTIGVNGINEMVRNFTRGNDDITTPYGHAFAVRLLDHLRARIVAFQEETGHMYNLEATPAEGTTYRFAKEDRKRWPDILQAGTAEMPYYTNSVAAAGRIHRRPFRGAGPAGRAADQVHRRHGAAPLHERTAHLGRGMQGAGAALARAFPPAVHHDHADVLDLSQARLSRRRARILSEMRRRKARRKATQARGVVTSEDLEPKRAVKDYTREAGMNSMIEVAHLSGVTLTDDERQRCEVWTRVMGYHRPVASFNIGKKGEHCERRFFHEERARSHL